MNGVKPKNIRQAELLIELFSQVEIKAALTWQKCACGESGIIEAQVLRDGDATPYCVVCAMEELLYQHTPPNPAPAPG